MIPQSAPCNLAPIRVYGPVPASLSTGRPGAGNLLGSCPCPAVLFAAFFSGRPCGVGSFLPCPAGLAQEFGQSRRRRQLSRYLRQVARVRVPGCGLSHPLREPFRSSSGIMPKVEGPDPRSLRSEGFGGPFTLSLSSHWVGRCGKDFPCSGVETTLSLLSWYVGALGAGRRTCICTGVLLA